jgi:phenylalanyl-tRNA synthetase beta chain
MTVIADADHAQAIAGVIGGEGSEVTDATTDIVLEVAAFDPRRVRATRRKLGISTDASYRFERGVDATACDRHLRYAVDLITVVAGGTPDEDPFDVRARIPPMPTIALRTSRVQTLLGEPIGIDAITQLLSSVGFAVFPAARTRPAAASANGAGAATSNSVLDIVPPTWRSDVTGEVEVIEEIARLHGYDRFSSDVRPFRPGTVPNAPLHETARRVRDACIAAGLFEARPLPFTKRYDVRSLRVRNPLAEDEAFLRQDILDTLAGRTEFNLAHSQRNVRLFEIGAVFARSEGDSGPLPDERMHVGAVILGDRRPPHFTEPKPPHFDEWDAKGLADSIGAAAFPGHVISCVPAEDEGLWTVTAGDVKIGVVRRVGLDAPAWAAPAFGVEINLEALGSSIVEPISLPVPGVAANTRATKSFKSIPTMPAIEVDLALIVPDTTRASDVERVIRESAGELLEQLSLFDEFRGPDIPQGSRSLAWALTFRHPERTLRDREIQGRTARILKTLEAELGVRQRTA